MRKFQISHVPQTQRPRMRSAVLRRSDPISVRAAWWRHSRPISSSGAALIRAVNLLAPVRPAEVKPPRVAGCCLSLTGPGLCQGWNCISSAAWLIKTCVIKTIYINKATTREKSVRADGEYERVLRHRGRVFTGSRVGGLWWSWSGSNFRAMDIWLKSCDT